MFCVSFIDVFRGLFYGVPTFSVGVFYIFHLFFELGCIRRVCIRTFAVIEREVRAVSHNGYRQALRFFVRAKRVTYRRPACNYRRTGSRRRLHRYRWFRRTRLPFHLVQRCRHRRFDIDLLGVRARQHRRWRRRKTRWTRIKKVKRRAAFFTPLPSSTKLWNERRRADAEFLGAKVDSFRPHFDHGVVPEEVLSEFCADRGEMFLASIMLVNKFDRVSLMEEASKVVKRLNLFVNPSVATGMGTSGRKTPKNCPLVWDTGASFGLTPFRSDFIDYTECSITVNDISRANTVIGIGTTLHKFQVNGEDFFMPCLSYHLPSAEIRLFSPQTYHTLYGGHSTVMGDRVEMYVDQFRVGIHIDRQSSNVPMVYNCNVSSREMRDHGPNIRSALPQYERKVDCLGGWSEDNLSIGRFLRLPSTASLIIIQEECVFRMLLPMITRTYPLHKRSCFYGTGNWELECSESKS